MIQPPSHTAAPFAANAPAPLAGRGGSRSRASRIAPFYIDTARDFVYLQNMTPSRRDADPRPSRSAPRRCGTRRKARHAAPGRFRRTRSGPRESLSCSPFALIRSRRFTPAADLDLDGDIDATDGTHAEGYEGWQLGWNELSHSSVANRLGYAGYQKDVNLDHYHVRNRVLEPHLGRWTRRDPLGYIDGMSLYEYVGGRSQSNTDAAGLASSTCSAAAGCRHIPPTTPPVLPPPVFEIDDKTIPPNLCYNVWVGPITACNVLSITFQDTFPFGCTGSFVVFNAMKSTLCNSIIAAGNTRYAQGCPEGTCCIGRNYVFVNQTMIVKYTMRTPGCNITFTVAVRATVSGLIGTCQICGGNNGAT